MTLTGEPNLVAIAEGYLKQIDLRKRQVAVRLQILDVDLLNQKEFDNSFALRTGNTFIVNDQGRMLVNFGGLKPPGSPQTGLPGNYEVDQMETNWFATCGVGAFSCQAGSGFYSRPSGHFLIRVWSGIWALINPPARE